jgi:hypothetical protein
MAKLPSLHYFGAIGAVELLGVNVDFLSNSLSLRITSEVH